MKTEKKNDSQIRQDILFTPAQKFYDILQDLIMTMLEDAKNNNIEGMLESFDEIYLLSFAFIEKYMKEKDYAILESSEDVHEILDNIQEETSDTISIQNSKILRQAKRAINEKKKILYKLMARGRLFVPLVDAGDSRPAALSSDDL